MKEEISSLKNMISSIQTDISGANNFEIVYPNGGTESHPATITIDTHYDIENPFQGYYVYCMAQVYFNGKWGETGWIYESGAYGVFAGQILPEDKIYVQTGSRAILTLGKNGGNGMQSGQDVTSAPCRVLVHKLGRITS